MGSIFLPVKSKNIKSKKGPSQKKPTNNTINAATVSNFNPNFLDLLRKNALIIREKIIIKVADPPSNQALKETIFILH